jgi:MFS family permease
VRRPRFFYGWAVLAAGFTLILFGYAMRNTFSVFYPVIVSDFSWTRGDTAFMYSLTILSYGLFAPVAGRLADRFNPKFVLAAGGLIVGGGIALCSLATSIAYFYVIYGVLVAVGLSLIGITPLTAVLTHWFGSKRGGMVFGLLGSGFGVSLISAPLFQWLISGFGWRNAYVLIGLFAVAVIVPVSIGIVRRSPEHQALLAHTTPAAPQTAGSTASRPTGWTVRQALGTRFFRLMLILGFCNMGFAQQVTIAHQVYYLRDVGHDPMVAAGMFGVFGVAFATGNISSFLSDRFGRLLFMVAGCVVAAGGMLLLGIAPAPESRIVAVVFAVCAGWGLGVTPPCCFAAIADRLHGKNYGAIQGTIILVTSVGGALGAWAGGALHDVTGSYDTAFALVQVALILAAVLAILATRPSAMPSGK